MYKIIPIGADLPGVVNGNDALEGSPDPISGMNNARTRTKNNHHVHRFAPAYFRQDVLPILYWCSDLELRRLSLNLKH